MLEQLKESLRDRESGSGVSDIACTCSADCVPSSSSLVSHYNDNDLISNGGDNCPSNNDNYVPHDDANFDVELPLPFHFVGGCSDMNDGSIDNNSGGLNDADNGAHGR